MACRSRVIAVKKLPMSSIRPWSWFMRGMWDTLVLVAKQDKTKTNKLNYFKHI